MGAEENFDDFIHSIVHHPQKYERHAVSAELVSLPIGCKYVGIATLKLKKSRFTKTPGCHGAPGPALCTEKLLVYGP